MIKHKELSRVDYREIIEGLPSAIYLCDSSGRITYYNEAAAILWGRKPELGVDLWCGSWKIYSKEGLPIALKDCPMAKTLLGGISVVGEEIIIERPDGIRVNILPHPQPIFDKNGKILGAINMLVDITDKRNKEIALQESEYKYKNLSKLLRKKVDEKTINLLQSEDRYHKMIDEVEDYAILQLDINGNILNWNKGAEKIKGYKEKDILGKNFKIFYQAEDRKADLPGILINRARLEGRANHEGWRIRKDGTKFWGSVVITSLHDDDGNIIGFTKVTRDLTEKKIAEDQLKQYAKELEIQNKELEQFAYVASHDLQEPLRKIQTFANLLERDIHDKDAMKVKIEKINASAQRMANLIQDILKYSKLSQIDEAFVDVDLSVIIENIKEDFELLLQQKKVKITYNKLPVIKGIPIQIHQLFSNLIDNAIKFNVNKPLIKITSKSFKITDPKEHPNLDRSKNYVSITVTDNGLGFEPQYKNQIFKLFQRLDSSKSGSGIGLALCKRIIEIHKGEISVSSELNKGTVFNIILPGKK